MHRGIRTYSFILCFRIIQQHFCKPEKLIVRTTVRVVKIILSLKAFVQCFAGIVTCIAYIAFGTKVNLILASDTYACPDGIALPRGAVIDYSLVKSLLAILVWILW